MTNRTERDVSRIHTTVKLQQQEPYNDKYKNLIQIFQILPGVEGYRVIKV